MSVDMNGCAGEGGGGPDHPDDGLGDVFKYLGEKGSNGIAMNGILVCWRSNREVLQRILSYLKLLTPSVTLKLTRLVPPFGKLLLEEKT